MEHEPFRERSGVKSPCLARRLGVANLAAATFRRHPATTCAELIDEVAENVCGDPRVVVGADLSAPYSPVARLTAPGRAPFGLARGRWDLRRERGGRRGRAGRCPRRLLRRRAREHMPKSHRDYGKWPPERMRAWGHSVGPNVGKVVDAILDRYRNPEFGYRGVLAITRDAKRVGNERLDAACARALAIAGPSGPTRRSVVTILKRGLESAPVPTEDDEPTQFLHHEHLRGGDYFNKETTQ